MIETLRFLKRWLANHAIDPDDVDVVLVVKDKGVKFAVEASIKADLPKSHMVEFHADETKRFSRGFPMTLEGTGVRIVTRDEVRPPEEITRTAESDALEAFISALKAVGYEVKPPTLAHPRYGARS